MEYCNFDKFKCKEMITNLDKIELLLIVDKYKTDKLNNNYSDLDTAIKSNYSLNKSSSFSKLNAYHVNEINIDSHIKLTKNSQSMKIDRLNIKEIDSKDIYYIKKVNNNDPFAFLQKNVNVIDFPDYIKCLELYKDVLKVFNSCKNKDKNSKELYKAFEKFDEEKYEKISKFLENNLEINDYNYFKTTLEYQYLITEKKEKLLSKCSDKYKNKGKEFVNLFSKASKNVIKELIEFAGFESIISLKLVNKKMNEIISNKGKFENLAKKYCEAIFNYKNIYSNDFIKLKNQFKSYFDMYKNRPRIKFGGLYYGIIRYTRHSTLDITNTTPPQTIVCFKYYRFYPNGEVYCLPSTEKDSKQIYRLVFKEGVEVRNGTFKIEDDILIIRMKYYKSTDVEHFFNIKKIEDTNINKFIDGLEFIKSELIEKNNERSPFLLNQHHTNIYKYRSIKEIESEFLFTKMKISDNESNVHNHK